MSQRSTLTDACRLSIVAALAVGVSGLARATERVPVDCAAVASVNQTINLSAGVYTEKAIVSAPLEITIPAGTDAARYQDCLVRQGRDRSDDATRYVEQVKACREAGNGDAVAVNGRTRLQSGVSQASTRACLQNSLDVEATLPE